MINIRPIYIRFLCSLALLLTSLGAYGSHIVGVDLFYTWMTGSTYQITLVVYGDCGPMGAGAFATLPDATPEICIYNGNSYVGYLHLAIQAPTEGVEITPVCAADVDSTQCTNTAFAIPGIKKFVYTGTYTLPTASAVWRFLYMGYMGPASAAGRAAAITNIVSGTVTQLIDTLNNSAENNSSPQLTVIPTPFFCLDNSDNYNPGAVDAAGDSLSFFLVPGKSSGVTPTTNTCVPGGDVSYVYPYTATAPLAASTFSFDQATGQISFYPNALQRALVVYNIEAYRHDTLIGTCQREMTFLVLTCTNTAPSASLTDATNGTVTDSTHFRICQNTGAFSVSMLPVESDTTNDITVTYSGLPAGASFTTTGNGTPTPHCTFSWTSTGVSPGSYTFYVTFTDNNCPLNGRQTLAYTITILPAPTVSYAIVTPAGCVTKAAVSVIPSGYGAPWSVDVSAGAGDTIQTFSGEYGTFTDHLYPGDYNFTIVNADGCRNYVSAIIPITVPFTPSGTFTNPAYCGLANGTITLYHLLPGTADTVTYYYDGILQPPVVFTVPSDSEVTLTGLGGGTYSDITVTYGFCVSAPVGPFTLVNPPFTIRTAEGTNPSWCGYCNGTITVYGVHPGELDSVYYYLGGVLQPPVAQFIGADSMVTLTGLCAGDYSYFYAVTGGGCVSNTAGPVTLTPPPFTMRALSFTNPSYCGICNGTITLYGLHPGQLDTINYTYNGAAQPPVIQYIGTDSMVTLTGLCNGVYAGFTAHTDGVCISNVLGPVTLTVPPFTMRAVTFTNPSYCGICNGTITLYGLHPGETDSIHYTYDGAPQTPAVFTIGTDSMAVITGLCAGTYAGFAAHAGGDCISDTLGPVLLTVPPFTMRAISFTNPDYCGICNGTITLYGLHPGETDSISFTSDGVPQPPFVVSVGADSMAIITGLCAGTYADFIARTGGSCVSNTLGPVALTVPPFTMRALSYTNPHYCGICNGTITLYGLHPGETDTISYTYNGVAQTPAVYTIGSDSTVVMTGLCYGVYDNFVARTGGVCVSDTLGPADLTVPPFTIGSLSYTNPTECGFCDGTITVHGIYPGENDTLNYTFNGVAQTRIISTIGTDSTIVLYGLCAGTYGGFVVNTGGVCVSNTLGPVTLVAPPIVPGFTYAIHEGCGGDTLQCTNTSWPPSELTYTWSFGDGGSDTATNPVHIYYSPGTFNIILTITNTKCVASDTQSITLNNLINAAFTDNPDSFICQGRPVTFTNASLGTALSYTWYFGDGMTDTNTNTVHIYTTTGTYSLALVVTNYVPCHDTVDKVLTVDSISAVRIACTDSVICSGHAVTFDALYAKSGSTGLIWTFGDSSSAIADVNPVVHAFAVPGLFTVTAEALYRACPDTSTSRRIFVAAYPDVNLGNDTSICPGSTAITIGDTRSAVPAGSTWLWNTGQTTPAIQVIEPGSYYVTVAIGGCVATDSIQVNNNCYLDIPNAFTPNGDGVNDYFFPRDVLARGLATFRMSIYNRWGEVIFETSSTDGRGWDGKFNNTPQPEGVYIYTIDATFIDGQKEHRQGNVTLLR